MTTPVKTRGSTVQNPSTTKYSLWTWIKGYAAWIVLFPLYLLLWGLASTVRTLPTWLTRKLLLWHFATTSGRPHDVRIPSTQSIPQYMLRWWKIKRNAYFNIYFHHVFRSDDDTALHDHPWWSFSVVLDGGYYEHRILDGGVHTKEWYGPGSILFRRSGDQAHRLQLDGQLSSNPLDTNFYGELPARTIFITGPVLRRWGFHHTEQWVDAYDWDDFQAKRGIKSMKMAGYAEQLKKG